MTYYAGVPVAFVPLSDLEAGALSGAPLATTVVTLGSTTAPIDGYRMITNAAVRADLSRPMHKATQTISFIMFLLWFVAAGIIGSVLYLQDKRSPALLTTQAEYQARVLPALAEQMQAETSRCGHAQARRPANGHARSLP